jgi:5-formyltetrahydrofolate cyclo-ligase
VASRNVGCYLPTVYEVQTTHVIARSWRAGKRIFVPVTDSKVFMVFREITANTPLGRNDFGIWEPLEGALIDPRRLDIVITPVVAFDDDNHRIGMGSGYYDRCFRFLKNRRKWLKPKLIGVAFESQRVDQISPNPWDIPLYRVVTNAN